MSYILEALKKAEAERKLGAVPNLHVQTVPAAIFEDKVPLLQRPSTWWMSGLFLILVILLAWYRPWQEKAASSTKAAASIEQSAPQRMAAAEPVPVPAPASPNINSPEEKSAVTSPSAGKLAVHEETTPSNEAATSEKEAKPKEPPRKLHTTSNEKPVAKAAASPEKQQSVEKKAGSDSPKSANGQHKGESLSAEPPVPALRELPEHIQRTLPAVTVEGYIYSPKASERSMLINNRLVREGEPISSGLILEKMLPGKEMILNFQGQRYRQPY